MRPARHSPRTRRHGHDIACGDNARSDLTTIVNNYSVFDSGATSTQPLGIRHITRRSNYQVGFGDDGAIERKNLAWHLFVEPYPHSLTHNTDFHTMVNRCGEAHVC
nr:hypothetical protein GCM10017611_02350 [Rhodococcus wratislaviensis]